MSEERETEPKGSHTDPVNGSGKSSGEPSGDAADKGTGQGSKTPGSGRAGGRGRGAYADLRTRLTSSEVPPEILAAEFLGTLLLVFFGVGSVVLAAEYIGTVGIALSFGLVLLALSYALGAVSGCHLNPAVTLGMLMGKRIDLPVAVWYWAAQIVGGIVGSAVLFLVAHQVPGIRTSGSFGSNGYDDRSAVRINTGGAFLAEIVLTFLLVFVVLAVTHRVAVTGFDGLPIGLALAVVHLVGIPLTGTSVNPARSIGPALFAGGAALSQLWLFLIAPLIGAALAALAHRVTHPPTLGAVRSAAG